MEDVYEEKGYTLVEILGIIVVIAIIAVITVPIITGIIIKARKASYKDSAYGMIEAAKLYLAGNIDSIKEEDELFFICDGKSCEYKGNKLYLKGPTPISGTIGITGKGEITLENVYNGKYYANKEEKEEVTISEEPSDILSRGELTEMMNQIINRMNALEKENAQLRGQHQSDIANLQNKINNLEEKEINIDKIYPVGSIYTTTSNVNPSSLFEGTTWERYGVGRTLLSTDGTSGNTGGSNTVTLTTFNLPSHSHTVTANGTVTSTFTGSTVTSGNNSVNPSATFTGGKAVTSSDGNHTHNVVNSSNNYGPFINAEKGDAMIHDNQYLIIVGHKFNTTSWIDRLNVASHLTAVSNCSHTHAVYTNGNVSLSNTIHTHSVTSKGSVSSIFTGSSVPTSSIGSGTPINIQNPYITVYMWKRVS